MLGRILLPILEVGADVADDPYNFRLPMLTPLRLDDAAEAEPVTICRRGPYPLTRNAPVPLKAATAFAMATPTEIP